MRILVLANVPPGLVGGAEVQALNLAHRWAVAGHSVTIAGHANSPLEAKNLSIIRIRTLNQNRLLRAASYLISTLWLLWRNQNQYDVIYCRFLKEQALVASLAKIIFRFPQPIIACPACASTGGDISTISRSPLKLLWIWLLNNGLTAINVMSQQIKREVLTIATTNIHISHIPNGVILPRIKPINFNHHKKICILFVGRLVEQKGLNVLLHALTLLEDIRSELTIDIIGDGPLRSKLTTQIHDLGLNNVVHLVGALPPDSLSGRLQQAELFILPSRYEGMSGALLEAIANGLPAIATRVSGSEEIIDDSIGWLIPVDNEKALAKAIREALILGHHGLRKMGTKARKKAESKFDIELVSTQYLDLFRDLINHDAS